MKKYKLTTNLGLKIIAFVFSAFLWLIVVNLDNPVSSRTFTEIPVTIVNDDIITSAGDVYQVVGEQTVSVVVYANREVRQHLSPDDIVATADIREMDTSTGLVPITITIPDYSGQYQSAEAVPRNLQIQREKSGRKVLALTADADGVERDGYVIGEMTVHPENVTITGPESVLDQIDRAVALVDVEGISEDEERPAELKLYDANGNIVTQNQLENNLGDDGLTVSIEVLKKKSVPVVADISGTPAEGYQYTGFTTEPETVQICGKSDVVDDVEEIVIPSSVISIDGADSPVEQTVNISSYLPEGISLVEESTGNITVTAVIERNGTRTINFLVSSIIINNLSEDMQVSYQPDAEITLTFSGDQEKLDVLDVSNAVSVDLETYIRPGTYEVPVSVDLPDGITLNSDVTVQLTLEYKSDSETDSPGGSDSSTGQGGADNSSGQENGGNSSGQDDGSQE